MTEATLLVAQCSLDALGRPAQAGSQHCAVELAHHIEQRQRAVVERLASVAVLERHHDVAKAQFLGHALQREEQLQQVEQQRVHGLAAMFQQLVRPLAVPTARIVA